MTITLKSFLSLVAIIAITMAVLAFVERLAPLHPRGERARGRAGANLTLSALVFIFNGAISTGAAVLLVGLSSFRPIDWSAMPLVVRIVVPIVVLDFFTWVAHWSMHKLSPLWRAHRVHHADPFLDVTTSYRQHPCETGWRFLFISVAALAFGFPAEGVVVYRMTSALQALLEHMNVRLPHAIDRVATLVWVSPNMHKLHHSREQRETDTNYGNIFSVFDRLFGTFTPCTPGRLVDYGLDEIPLPHAKSLPKLLALPFARERPTTDAPAVVGG